MKRALVIGAGYFGRYLICALMESGCVVDVVEKGTVPQYNLRNSGCRYIRDNAWNLASIKELHIPDYECCFICLNDNLQINLHVIKELRKEGARQIVIRSDTDQLFQTYLDAGASRVVCPEQVASRTLVREMSKALT